MFHGQMSPGYCRSVRILSQGRKNKKNSKRIRSCISDIRVGRDKARSHGLIFLSKICLFLA